MTCLLTQQVSSLRQALGSEDLAENLSSNLATKIFCNNAGETARYASQLIGDHYVDVLGTQGGSNRPADPDIKGGTNAGFSFTQQKRPWVEASELQTLRRGGKANDYKVDTIMFIAGRTFPGKKEPQPYKKLTFKQD